MLSLSALGQSATHQLAADIALGEGSPPADAIVHKVPVNGMTVTVTISKGISPPDPKVKPPPECPPAETPIELTMRDVELCIYKAAPGPMELPVSVKRLAKAAGYSCSSYFREVVRQMTDAGHLVRITGGLRRAK